MQNIGDTFGQVFRAIAANKVRSFLTMFGIAWGVGSMLLLISVGRDSGPDSIASSPASATTSS